MSLSGPILLPDGEAPEDGQNDLGRLQVAIDFFKRFAWEEDRIASHLPGIDLLRPVHEIVLHPETILVRWQRREESAGYYFGVASVTATQISGGKQISEIWIQYSCKEPVPALQFTSRESMATWPRGPLSAASSAELVRIFVPPPFLPMMDPQDPRVKKLSAAPWPTAVLPRIESDQEFETKLLEAMKETEQQMVSHPEEDLFRIVHADLVTLLQKWEKKVAFSPEELGDLRVPSLAVRRFEKQNPEYASLLQALFAHAIAFSNLSLTDLVPAV